MNIPDLIEPPEEQRDGEALAAALHRAQQLELRATHVGRSFTDHRLEDECPCPKAACGLVVLGDVSPECRAGHRIEDARTIRQTHPGDRCPAEPGYLDPHEDITLDSLARGQDLGGAGIVLQRLIGRGLARYQEEGRTATVITEHGSQVWHARQHARSTGHLAPLTGRP